MLSVQDFEKAGYRRFDGHIGGAADYGMEKKFSDSLGTRYYSVVHLYDWRRQRLSCVGDFGFEVTAQFTVSESIVTNLDFVVQDGTTVSEIENFYSCYWEFIGEPYCQGVEND